MKKIGIIGSTGSIGTQTLEVIRELNRQIPGSFQVVCLSCGSNIDLLIRQAVEFGVRDLCAASKEAAAEAAERLGRGYNVYSGADGLCLLASMDMDVLVTAVVGMSGIMPTLCAVKKGTAIALANKETLVAAGETVMKEAAVRGVPILPVDSEHSAVFQCLRAVKREELEGIVLTCSGGPFRGYSRKMLENVTAVDALSHPTWNMGGKITIDSATLMNKGLEVIEAARLYGLSAGEIEVVVHPQSVIHSMIRTRDGGILAQMGVPSMKLPIQYALTYPDRLPGAEPALDFSKTRELTFEAPDTEVFEALPLAFEALRTGGTMPACMNAANEKAVRLFLDGKIGFTAITEIVKKEMEKHSVIREPSIEDIMGVSREVYASAGEGSK